MRFHWFSLLIRKSFLSSALTKCGILSNLSLASLFFSIFLLCFCILRKPAIFDFITNISYYYKYQSHFIVILKMYQNWEKTHSLFPAWECKQTWLLPDFIPTINFTSSQFPAYEKQKFGVFPVRISSHSDWIQRHNPYLSVFNPNLEKYGAEKLQIRTLFS